MPIPAGVARWTIEGTSTAEEVWAFDFWTRPGTGVPTFASWQATNDAYAGLLVSTGLAAALASLIPTTGAVTALRSLYYRNGPNAEYSAVKALSPAVAGTSTTRAALVMSFCVSTLTGRTGQSYQGRMYLPACGMPLDTTHKFTAGSMTAVVDKLRLMLSAGYTDGQYGPPVVVSRTKGEATPITQLRYDLKPDTQRRRANNQSPGARTVVTVG